MPTDPTPQAGQSVCVHLWETRHESWPCGAGMHTDSYEVCTKCGTVQDQTEPSPAPPAQPQEPLSAQDYYQRIYAGVPKNYADWIKFADNYSDYRVAALTAAREGRDRLQSDLAAIETDLGVMVEERDQAREAIYWADGQRGEFRERGPKEGAYWWRKELMERAGLKPVSDRQPEGEKP